MRVYRFDEDGKAKDAATFNDTYMLYDLRDNAFLNFACIGICHKEKPNSPIRLEAIRTLENSFYAGYDYACVFQGYIFPVKDEETQTIQKLTTAAVIRKRDGSYWKYF